MVSSVAVHGGLGAALMWAHAAPPAIVEPAAMSVSLLPSTVIASSAQATQGAPRSLPTVHGATGPSPPDPPVDRPGDNAATPSNASAGQAADAAAQDASSGAHGDETPVFEAALLAHIERFRRYPEDARRTQQQGVVMVGFAMGRKGDLLDLWVDRSSGFAALDAEAVSTLRRAQPLPLIPKGLPDELQVVLPVSFALR